jgi:hypothetical protein
VNKTSNLTHKQSTKQKHCEKEKVGDTTPQKANKNIIEDLVESEGNEPQMLTLEE